MSPGRFSSHEEATEFILQKLGRDIRLATPLGLGKPNMLLNQIYSRVREDKSFQLKIYTALSLQVPRRKEELARQFLEPFAQRHWGSNYPNLLYAQDSVSGRIPANIQVHEFYFQAGSALHSSHLQHHYQSMNYTHVADGLLNANINLIVQLVSERQGRYSLSCNPDLTLDVVDLFKQAGRKLVVVGVVHPDLPFLEGEAEVAPQFFDVIVSPDEPPHELFALPRQPISPEDHLIGVYASQLVRDEGTIQIGIGSLSEAVVSALCIRQNDPALYQKLVLSLNKVPSAFHSPFEKGLYGLTEMLTDGFMHLRRAGILKREVTDEATGRSTWLHGSFILGSKPFYKWLRDMPSQQADGLRMTRVSKVNDLYDPNETRLRMQRVHPRFFNTTMQMTLLGEAMSETLSDGTVVSGVGGQYNFVAMAHELKSSHSVILLRSARLESGGRTVSNLVWSPGHVTIPRHLRDIVVTEYGVAELKGKTDEECIKALLNVCDSRFQKDLLNRAKKAGKISKSYMIPEKFQSNTPEAVKRLFTALEFRSACPPFPFGSDFSKEEERIALALSALQEEQKKSKIKVLKRLFVERSANAKKFSAELERMGLKNPTSLKMRFYRRLLTAYLSL